MFSKLKINKTWWQYVRCDIKNEMMATSSSLAQKVVLFEWEKDAFSPGMMQASDRWTVGVEPTEDFSLHLPLRWVLLGGVQSEQP